MQSKIRKSFSIATSIKWSGIFVVCLLLLPAYSQAISLPWSTTFNYGPCTQRGGGGQTDCANVANDSLYWSWGADGLEGHYTGTVSAANNPVGGGNGMRSWVGDGVNVMSAPIRLDLPNPKEIWVRWYERWESGAKWNSLSYSKSLYFHTLGAANPYAGFVEGDNYRIYNQSSVGAYPLGKGGWNTVYPGGVSDGSWHCYELHMKLDTNSSDGVGQIWVDGKLVSSMTNVNWSNGDSASQNGFSWIEFKSNQSNPGNGRIISVDYDDMVIYGSTPPNRDANGNPFIGPIGGSIKAPLAAPTGLKIIQ